MEKPSTLQVLLADDHALVRDGLRRLIDEQPGLRVIAEASDGVEAVTLARTLLPDVAVVDISMPRLDGPGVAAALKDLPQVRVLGLTRHDDSGFVDRMLEAGAIGFVFKQSPSSILVEAIRTVATGARFLDPHIARDQPSPAPSFDPPREPLTPDEERILRLIASGSSQSEAARHLLMSPEATATLRKTAMRKLQLSGRVSLLRFAEASGWLPSEPD